MRIVPTIMSMFALANATSLQAQDLDSVRVRTEHVSGPVYVLYGAGSNIGVLAGAAATLLVDDQYAAMESRIRAALGAITTAPVRYLIDTHWHPDHVGGNEWLARDGATVISHMQTAQRMSVPQYTEFFQQTQPAAALVARPVLAFSDSIRVRVDDMDIVAFHVDAAHTDGDVIVHFPGANVIQLGDLFFSAQYPFIDLTSGGGIAGMIDAIDIALARTDSATRIIPGHGPVASRDRLVAYRAMLTGVRGEVARLLSVGATLDATIAAHPSAAFDAEWGRGWLTPDAFVGVVYRDLARRRSQNAGH